MEYKQLGKSSLHISRIGYGCMSLKPGQSDLPALVDKAIGAGINFFDTADIYDKGLNEEQLGKVLKGKRKHLILATKVGNQPRPDGSGWDWNPGKSYILKAAEESLKRLKTDYIDLYQLHGGTIDDPISETIEAFELLKEQGKIRYYGISSIRPNVIREYVQQSNIVSVMMQYSLLDRRPEENCLPLLQAKNIGVLARGTLASGLLADKPSRSYLSYTPQEVAAASAAIGIFSNTERTKSQTAIRFVLNNPAITSAIVGMRTLQQLMEALGTLSSPELSLEQYHALSDAVTVNKYTDHR